MSKNNSPTADGDTSELRKIVREELSRMAESGLSRRDVLKLGAGSLAGATLASSMSQPARAAAQGNLGTTSDPWSNVYAANVDNPIGTLTQGETDFTGPVSADQATIGDTAEAPRLGTERTGAPNELTIIPSSGNVIGSALLLPAGTEDRSHWMFGNNSDPDNFGAIKWELDGAIAKIEAFTKGTGTLPTEVQVDNIADGYVFFATNTGSSPGRALSFRKGTTEASIDATGLDYTADGTATGIMQRGNAGGLVSVAGETSGGKRFSDLVHFGITSVSTVSTDSFNGAAARTYSHSSGTLEVSISDGGTVYTIHSTMIGGIGPV